MRHAVHLALLVTLTCRTACGSGNAERRKSSPTFDAEQEGGAIPLEFYSETCSTHDFSETMNKSVRRFAGWRLQMRRSAAHRGVQVAEGLIDGAFRQADAEAEFLQTRPQVAFDLRHGMEA